MRRIHSLSAVAFSALLVAACDTLAPVSPEPVVDGPQQPVRQARWTTDDEFARIAREEVRGFAGYYLEKDGTTVLRLVDPTQREVAETRFRGELDHIRRGRMRFAPNRTIVRPATYDFAQLKGWHDDLLPLLQRDNVILIDVDEVENRVRVGVEDLNAIADVRREATRLGIPVSAVHAEIQPRTEFRQTVQSWNDTIKGGIQIAFGQYVCSLGFNAQDAQANWIFVTNSHCTNVYLAYDGGTIYQNTVTAANAVGPEIADRPFWACNGPGTNCRWSDAAYIDQSHNRTIGQGLIARTQWPTSPPLTVYFTELQNYRVVSRFNVGDAVPVGMYIDKTGRTTGSTYGQVTYSCVTIGNFLCQDVSTILSAGGDSGSPTYEWLGGDQVRLMGVMWGGPVNDYFTTYSSRLTGIEQDLGNLYNVCVPGSIPAC